MNNEPTAQVSDTTGIAMSTIAGIKNKYYFKALTYNDDFDRFAMKTNLKTE